jgi:hypothetical protein
MLSSNSMPYLERETRLNRVRLASAIAGWIGVLVPTACSSGSQTSPSDLRPIEHCSSVAQCKAADPRYDSCIWVCTGDVTYCEVSCTMDSDCTRRADLPSNYTHCNIPRQGSGFCSEIDNGYKSGDCVQNTLPISSGGSNTGTSSPTGSATCTSSSDVVYPDGHYICNTIGGNKIMQCKNGAFVQVATCDCTVTTSSGTQSTSCDYGSTGESTSRACTYGYTPCVECIDGLGCEYY